MKCKTCKYYNLYEMITGGPFSYAGRIPCQTCRHFTVERDNYEPMDTKREILDKFLKHANSLDW